MCSICFDTCLQHITCSNDCDVICCKECLGLVIKYAYRDKIIPKCIVKNCTGYYLISCISTIFKPTSSTSSTFKQYKYACLEYFLRDKSNEIATDDIIKHIRDEKKIFIQLTFPKAVTHVISIALQDKLRAIEKRIRNNANNKQIITIKKCINLWCNGTLFPKEFYTECIKCAAQFCVKCEQLFSLEHVCTKENIESIDFIKNMISCPKCFVPIERSFGCDNMTCANCGQYFKYDTGEKGGYGGGYDKAYNFTKFQNLSAIYADKINIDIFNALIKFENKQPKNYTNKNIVLVLKKYLNEIYTKREAADLIVKYLQTFINNKNKQLTYGRIANQIDQLLQQTIDVHTQTKIITLTNL